MNTRPADRPDPHPDDEALSASVDDQAGPEVVEHLTNCRDCQARVLALVTVQKALAAATPALPSGLSERAVAAAGAAWDQTRRPAPPVRQSDATVVDLAARRRPGRLFALGAAAAAVLALVAVPALLKSDPPRETAAQDQATDESGRAGEKSATNSAGPMRPAGPETAAAELAESGDFGTSAGPDLGEQDEVSDVARAVRVRTMAPAPAPAPAADAAAPPPSGAAPPPSTPPQSSTLSATASANAACDGIVRARAATGEVGDLGLLVYSATLRYQGEPALALVYRKATANMSGDVLFIVASGNCRSLAVSNL